MDYDIEDQIESSDAFMKAIESDVENIGDDELKEVKYIFYDSIVELLEEFVEKNGYIPIALRCQNSETKQIYDEYIVKWADKIVNKEDYTETDIVNEVKRMIDDGEGKEQIVELVKEFVERNGYVPTSIWNIYEETRVYEREKYEYAQELYNELLEECSKDLVFEIKGLNKGKDKDGDSFYEIFCMRGKDKFKVSLLLHIGITKYPGGCRTWRLGMFDIKRVNDFEDFNYVPKEKLTFENKPKVNSCVEYLECDVFSYCNNGGNPYYPEGTVEVYMDKFIEIKQELQKNEPSLEDYKGEKENLTEALKEARDLAEGYENLAISTKKKEI